MGALKQHCHEQLTAMAELDAQYPGIPPKARAYDQLNRLLQASSPTRRTPIQEQEIAEAWEMCGRAEYKEYLAKVRT